MLNLGNWNISIKSNNQNLCILDQNVVALFAYYIASYFEFFFFYPVSCKSELNGFVFGWEVGTYFEIEWWRVGKMAWI